MDVLNKFRDKPSGTLRLNVPISAARLVLPAILPSLLAAYREIRLEVVAPRSFDSTATRRAALQADEHTVPVASRDIQAAPTVWHRLAFHSCRRPICPRASRSRIVRRATGYADVLLSQGRSDRSALWGLTQGGSIFSECFSSRRRAPRPCT
jgi:DNA-binding transcriptional LysR family regulator